jgi:hypothetical protein
MRRCKHERAVRVEMVVVETYECVKCGAKGVRSMGHADEPEPDVSAGRIVAMSSPVSHNWNLYLLEGGAIAITAGDQDNAWGWDPTRTIAEQLDECLSEYRAEAASFDAIEYEIARAADPDCRDEDDGVDQSAVCSCAGDQLQAETCPEVES